MESILASSACYCCISDDLGFSGPKNNYAKFKGNAHNRLIKTRKSRKFQVEMQQTELPPKVGLNGRAAKMVPTTDIKERRSPSNSNNTLEVNGSAKNVVTGQSLDKRTNELPPIDGLKVLPSDEGFSWANENYNSFQRTIDVCSFVLSLRVRILLDNAKWSYIGAFSEDKQAARRRRTASWLREYALQLGPTFYQTRSTVLDKIRSISE